VFGVELEMEPRGRSSQSEVIGALGGRSNENYILKSDGSLNCGVELVTIPLTLEQHKKDFDWHAVLKPVARIAKSGAGTTSCGIHVHINKRALTALQIGKMLVFANSPACARQLTVIAQRESNGYCNRSKKRPERVLKNLEFCHALVTYCRDCSLADIERWDLFADWLLKRRGQYPELVKFLDGARMPKFIGAVKVNKITGISGVTESIGDL
jgi:hypothetical protein